MPRIKLCTLECVEPAIAEGEGVGLIGSFGEVPYFEIGATRIQHEGIRSRIVMHPAIADLDLGWSLMLADVLRGNMPGFPAFWGARRTPRSWTQRAGGRRWTAGNSRMSADHLGARGAADRGTARRPIPGGSATKRFFHFDGLLGLWRESADDLPGCVLPIGSRVDATPRMSTIGSTGLPPCSRSFAGRRRPGGEYRSL